MQFFPVYLNTAHERIIISGAGECALAKLRLLVRTQAEIVVSGENPAEGVQAFAREGRITLLPRALDRSDLEGALLVYAANDDPEKDATVATLARSVGVPVLIVDNLDASDFITPAIVDRDPVTVAIGTEGAAPVLARKIKADVEEMLPVQLGLLARIGKAFRPFVNQLPFGRPRRDFWARYYFERGPEALEMGEVAVEQALHSLLDEVRHAAPKQGHVHFVGAGPGDPELLTLKARKLLHEADVVIHDRLVPSEILELARREATIIEVGKTPFGSSWKQEDINALLLEHGQSAQVVRLKSGDCGIFGRLDEEIEALRNAGVTHDVVPGITSAAAAAASLKVSLTQRDRNSELRIITGHEAKGFSELDWRSLAAPGMVAAIYMGKAAASFLQGRLLMHGAQADTPVTIVENASRSDQRIIPGTLVTLPNRLRDVTGPAVLMLGLQPAEAAHIHLQEAN